MSEIYKTQTAMCTFFKSNEKNIQTKFVPISTWALQHTICLDKHIYIENKLLNLIPWKMALIFAQLLTLS